MENGGGFIFQNSKFDFAALEVLGLWSIINIDMAWAAVRDTLLAGHLLNSVQPHDLTTMCAVYLGLDIEPHELALEKAVQWCRRQVRRKSFKLDHGDWAIAEKGREGMPSAGAQLWKADAWLPQAYATHMKLPEDHEYWTVLRDYANADSASTLALWKAQERIIRQRGLWEIYLERLKVLPIAYGMESRGPTLSKTRMDEQAVEYEEASESAGRVCTNIAEGLGVELTLPKSGNNGSLTKFCFETLKLPPLKRSDKTGTPSLDASVLETYKSTLPPNSKALLFIKSLGDKRKRDTALQYMSGYQRFWLPVDESGELYKMHPSINPTGTKTLRWSSSAPNEQNISKREDFNLRYMFGPAHGREWWSCDAENIELRLPAYEAGEQAMIDLFERPNDPPYFGSNHLLCAHILHEEFFDDCESCLLCSCEVYSPRTVRNPKAKYCSCAKPDKIVDGRVFKKRYASSKYQRTKNGNFAVQYGAQQESGTADRAYGIVGGQAKIQSRLGKISDLNKRMIAHAVKHGYVETIPDRRINPNKGYPVVCTRTENGKVKPTVPLSYHIQSTAMWWMQSAMIRCEEQLKEWRSKGFDAYIVMQIHDEIVFDFPVSKVDPRKDAYSSNLSKIRVMQKLMAMGGDDVGIPTPVSCEYHPINWSEGIRL